MNPGLLAFSLAGFLAFAATASAQAPPWHFEFSGGKPNKLVWQTEAGRNYDLFESADLAGWTHVDGFPKPGTGAAMEHSFTAVTRGFFQIAPVPIRDLSRTKLESLISNIAGAAGKSWQTRDNLGNGMDTVKIIANPAVTGQLLGIYHSYDSQGVGRVKLATSTNLLSWTFVVNLDGSSGANATQPTILAVGTGFMAAWEKEPNNHVKLAYYPSWTALQTATPSNTMDLPRTLSTYAEGTPNIYSATATSADVGFHFYAGGVADKNARGTMTNWTTWTASAQPQIDQAVAAYNLGGNVAGDRDNITFDGSDFVLVEGGGGPGSSNFSGWRVLVYDPVTQLADKLSPNTGNGVYALANPTVSRVTFQGQDTLVVTLFVPSQNNVPGTAGALIYYNYINSSPDITEAGTASDGVAPNPAGQDQSMAFDNSTNSTWLVYSPTGTIGYTFAGNVVATLTSYTVTSANDVPGRDPQSWTLQGSNDGTTWTMVDTQSAQSFTSRLQTKTYPVSSTNSYHRYRLNVTANNGEPYLQIAEMQLFGQLSVGTVPEPFFRTYQAEGTLLSHGIGRADGDGWSANTAQDSPGHLVYGPYATDIPTGSRSVIFRMLVDNNTANNDNVVTVDVYNADSGTTLASQAVSRQQWSAANAYQNFSLAFSYPTEGQRLEFRVYWHDKSFLKIDSVQVQ